MAEREIGGGTKAGGLTAGGRRVARGAAALVVGLGLVYGVAAAGAPAAAAAPKYGYGTASCYWGGVEYSYGAVVTSGGRKYECRNGQWVDIGPATAATYQFAQR